MTFTVLLLCVLTITLQVYDATAWGFKPATTSLLPMRPDPSQFTFSTTLMCEADTPLVKCHVHMYSQDNPHDFVDLSRGANSGSISRYRKDIFVDGPVYNVSYHGTGLGNGQCGAVYSLAVMTSSLFGCRGVNAEGEWHDMHLSLVYSNERESVPAIISPFETIAKPGDDVNILLHSGPMTFCRVINAITYTEVFSFPDTNEVTNKTKRYFGAGLHHGDCGVTLLNVSEVDNGLLRMMGMNDNQVSQLIAVVIIAAPPAEVSLNVDKLTYSEGDTLTASCSSLLSRPVANLTWTLDDRIIRQDAKREGGEDEVWRWSWEKQNITQTMSLTLEPGHFGKKLECRVQHLDNVITNSDYVIKHV